MTRAVQVTQAVSAMRKARATTSSPPEPASMAFGIYEDNGGSYHWRIVDDDGETLVRSASFNSYEDAKQAAGIVHRGASGAAFELGSENPPPVGLPARGDPVSAGDRLDAERRLDEGGSFHSETVAR